jgi:hypothetical protein
MQSAPPLHLPFRPNGFTTPNLADPRRTIMLKPIHPESGQPFVHPDLPAYLSGVVGYCGHRVAESEWRAGLHTCERCPASDYPEPEND